jgi:cyclic-di-GMP phosphodiesterase TipF (flagellum assembly factor)
MFNKAAASRNLAANDSGDNVVRLSLFDRPLASGKAPEKFTVYSYLTFKNMVIGLGLVTLLVFLASAVSLRMAFLTASLLGLMLLILLEISSRRKWETDMLDQLQRMGNDYDRLVRDVARNRNDTAQLRKGLSDAAGVAARLADKAPGIPGAPGEPVEQRMIKGLVEQLSRLSELPEEEPEEAGLIPEQDLEIPDEPATADPEKVGLHLTEPQVLQLVKTAARQDRIDLFLQPVVGLPQRKIRFYEMLSRLRIKPGVYLPASRYVGIAHRQDLMPVIDNLLLLRGLQIVRSAGEGSNYNRAFFFNIASATLNDPKFMGDLVEFIAQNRTLAPRLIFELGQTDLALMNADVLPVLDGLSKLGCRFSMDQVKSLAINFDQLDQRHIRFVKVDAALLMNELKDDTGLQRLKRLKGEFDRNGIDLIVEKIETDRQLLEMLEIDVDYGQGYLFGRPVLYDKN